MPRAGLSIESQAPIIQELERCAVWAYHKLATSLIQLSIAQSLAQIIKHFEYPMISQGESPPVPGDKL